MTAKQIIHVPDPRLKQVCAPVEKVDGETRDLLDAMILTMHQARGIGLAASQVGVLTRALVIDIARDGEPPDPIAMVNPEIAWASDETKPYEEGCLSIPDIYETVERPAKVGVHYIDRNGSHCDIEADGLLAVVVQHEIDHLNGILFIDYLSKLKRTMILRKVKKAQKLKADD